jgi:uncharacterized alkaline shock family protein YloU
MTEHGEISIAPRALQQLVVDAAEAVTGATVRRLRRGLDVDLASRRVALVLAAPYGAQLAELAEAVQASVAEAVGRMCDVEVEAVDVTVEELT